jgi:hypothetical protein
MYMPNAYEFQLILSLAQLSISSMFLKFYVVARESSIIRIYCISRNSSALRLG